MKHNPIRKASDIKNGEYLKCIIGPYGEFWTTRILVTKRPYKSNTGYLVVNYKAKYRPIYHVQDLIGYGYGRTFKFSDKLQLRISKAKDVFDFIFIITGESIDKSRQEFMLEQWEYDKEMDHMVDASWGDLY